MASARGCNTVNFSAVGGLKWHLERLHQMVLMPALCRDVYDRFHMKSPRGILFYGPPGTGKTLVAGALAQECSQAARRVEFYYRKSTDILSMWLGESEKNLVQLFEEARKHRPAIIFFDEIDGLAPARCTRADHVHTSIVSTLLALMDGLDDASEVVVIGATNRVDAVDPALRRPGRFDAELFFPLPGTQARLEILQLLLQPWKEGDRPPEPFLQDLALSTAGYCGADLQALCRDAVTCGLCRQFPDLADHRRGNRPSSSSLRRLHIKCCDFVEAKSHIVPATHRIRGCPLQELCPQVQALFGSVLDHAVRTLRQHCPFQFLHPADSLLQTPTHGSRLVLCGTPQQGQTRHLAPALLVRLQHLPVYPLYVVSLFDSCWLHPEDACIQVMKEARGNAPSVLYLPDVSSWWGVVGEQTRAVFLALVRDLSPAEQMLLLATTDCPHADLQDQLQDLFREELGQVVHMRDPNAEEREAYYKPLRIEAVRPPHHPAPNNRLLESCNGPHDTDEEHEHHTRTRSKPPNGRKRCGAESPCRRSKRVKENSKPRSTGKKARPTQKNATNTAAGIQQGSGPRGAEFHSDSPREENIQEQCCTKHVDIDRDALDAFFEHLVAVTEGCTFQTLEALYSGLNNIICKYSAQLRRQQLLKDMQIFLKNYEEKMKK